jgi:hypothetical protein
MTTDVEQVFAVIFNLSFAMPALSGAVDRCPEINTQPANMPAYSD